MALEGGTSWSAWAEVAGCDDDLAAQALAQADHDVRVAILMAKFGLGPGAARQRLAEAGDSWSQAMGSEGGQ